MKREKSTILVTGNLGYIGSVLTPMLLKKGYRVIGLDSGYYKESAIQKLPKPTKQIIKDVRKTSFKDLKCINAIIHLAALSNDPLGELDEKLTEEINFRATVRLAKIAKKLGVKRFIYSSSQSMYGISKTDYELEEDNSKKNAITIYAKTKWKAECELKKLNSSDFTVACLRPSTVFGRSPNLRTDIVFNNLVACAYTTGKIEIKSDGTPWRPAVHVEDISNAFIATLEAPKELVSGQAFNVGNGNFTVRELAKSAQKAVPGSTLIFTGEHGKDSRTYKVSFKKIARVLKKYYRPKWTLEKGAKELVSFFKKSHFTEEQFRGRNTNRLMQIKYLIEKGRIDNKLTWKK